MSPRLSAAQIWTEIAEQMFAVVGYVTPRGEARTAGVVYRVRDRRLYFNTDTEAWKARHLQENPSISVTVLVPRRVAFLPWIRIPPATIAFQGSARILSVGDAPAGVVDALVDKLEPREELLRGTSVAEVTAKGHFVTYGIGVPVRTMLKPYEAAGRVAVE